jgi:hypothetical protein
MKNQLLIKNINIIPISENTIIKNMDVLVKDGHILKITKTDKNTNHEGQVIHGKDKFLMPGLWDNLAHIDGGKYLPLFLANGITTIRDLGNSSDKIFELRDKIKNREIVAPDLYICGPILGGHPYYWRGSFWTIKTEEEGRKAVKTLNNKKVDFIKAYVGLPNNIFRAILEQSTKDNLKVTGLTSIEAIEAGQIGIEHLDSIFNTWSDSALAEVKWEKTDIKSGSGYWHKATDIKYNEANFKTLLELMKNKSIYFTPALIQEEKTGKLGEYKELLKDDQLKYLEKSDYEKEWKPENMSLWYENIYFIYKKETSKVKDLADNSILLAGSDTPNPFVVPGISLHEELELLSKGGISNYEILKAATINGAKFVDKEKSIGTVEEGKIANLLILGSNPLEDINNSKDISGVILHGNYISKKELDDKVKIYS